MNPKDKAKELFDKMRAMEWEKDNHSGTVIFTTSEDISKESAKRCALITVDEIIKELLSVEENYALNEDFGDQSLKGTICRYWAEVKMEIEIL